MIAFTIIGVVSCIVLVLLALSIVGWLFVYPACQAISVINWKKACLRKAGLDSNLSFRVQTNIFCEYYQVGGFSCERMSNNYGEWFGIGRWRVYEHEYDEAP